MSERITTVHVLEARRRSVRGNGAAAPGPLTAP
jgi:hypothetical protein